MERNTNKLEEAANAFASSETLSEYENSLCVSSFIAGTEWQKENMWIPVEEKLPDANKPCFVITKNNKCSVSNMYIPKDCHGKVIGEKEWKGSLSFKESIVAWMPIPEFKKGE
jgi:hypothetical protein